VHSERVGAGAFAETRGVATPFSVSPSHRGKRRVCRGAHEKVAQLVSRLLVRSGAINRPGGGGEAGGYLGSGELTTPVSHFYYLITTSTYHISIT